MCCSLCQKARGTEAHEGYAYDVELVFFTVLVERIPRRHRVAPPNRNRNQPSPPPKSKGQTKKEPDAQIITRGLRLSLLPEEPHERPDFAFQRVERGVAVLASLVAGSADEVGLGVGPPANVGVCACGDAGCGGYGNFAQERERDLFAGCRRAWVTATYGVRETHICWRDTWKRRGRYVRW